MNLGKPIEPDSLRKSMVAEFELHAIHQGKDVSTLVKDPTAKVPLTDASTTVAGAFEDALRPVRELEQEIKRGVEDSAK